MAYTTIDDPSAYFHVNLHSGNETNNTDITFNANAGDFQPDWIWFKGRTSSAIDHALFDSSRGTTKILNSNNENAENAQGSTLKAFNSNGFRVGDDAGDYGVNKNGRTYVTWNWKANGGTTTTNDASATSVGSLDSVYQANTTAGFSIVTYTGAGGNQTIAHGLGAVPKWILIKRRDDAGDWTSYHSVLGNEKYMRLNSTNAIGDQATYFNDTTPTSTVFTVGSAGDVNQSTGTFVAYCFAEKQGYSKFGSYVGNGNDDGPFVYTGFKPAWLMIKRTDGGTNAWGIFDSARGPFNEITMNLDADRSDAENTATNYDDLDFLSNGFKLYEENDDINASSGEYIYMAFAEHPFVSSEGVPTTAR